jgi:TRAP-type C4-dicarboxylate transport system substrate-binding protein
MNKKIRQIFILSLILVLTFVLAACGGKSENNQGSSGSDSGSADQGTKKVTIKIAHPNPTSHINHKAATFWKERMEEKSNGAIQVEIFPGEQLGSASSLLNTAKNKIADISYVVSMYYSDVLPLSGIASNPGLVNEVNSGAKAYNKLLKEDLYELEYKPNGVKPLWGAVSAPAQILTSKKPMKTIEDFKGLKTVVPGGSFEQMMHNWGATPVVVTGAEIFSSWERGIVEGAVLGISSIPAYQLESLVKYASTNAALSAFGFAVVVNENVFNSWPKEIQDIVQETADETLQYFIDEMNGMENGLRESLKDQIEFFELPEDELNRWNESLKVVTDKWAQDLGARGLPAADLVEKFSQYIQEFKQG